MGLILDDDLWRERPLAVAGNVQRQRAESPLGVLMLWPLRVLAVPLVTSPLLSWLRWPVISIVSPSLNAGRSGARGRNGDAATERVKLFETVFTNSLVNNFDLVGIS